MKTLSGKNQARFDARKFNMAVSIRIYVFEICHSLLRSMAAASQEWVKFIIPTKKNKEKVFQTQQNFHL